MTISSLSRKGLLTILVASAGWYPAIANAQSGQLSVAHSRSTGKIGLSTTIKNWKESQTDAITKCGVRDCAILPGSGQLPAQSPTCVAWAVSREGNYYKGDGYKTPESRRPEKAAIASCVSAKQTNCKNVHAFCP